MKNTWKKIQTNIVKGYQSVSHKSGELTKIGRLKLEMIATKRDIEKAFIELGGRVYHSFTNDSKEEILKDEVLENLVNLIQEKENRLKQIENKLQQIRDQRVE